jgi:recombination protein RecR
MNVLPQSVQKLIRALERLPGLGPKSAARLAMHLLRSPENYVTELGTTIRDLKNDVIRCETCNNITSNNPCDICSSEERDVSVVCVVEDPLDVVAFENGTDFNGLYHVLGGCISPVNGVGPEDLTIQSLIDRVKQGSVKELIIATNPNIEGEATAMYIREEISKIGKTEEEEFSITRLARGLPTGADLEYADRLTLNKAFEGRTTFE